MISESAIRQLLVKPAPPEIVADEKTRLSDEADDNACEESQNQYMASNRDYWRTKT